MYIKIHRTNTNYGIREIVAVCDEDLLGKTIKGGKIEIKISESFYKGEKKSELYIIEILKKSTNINLIGKESVAAGLKAGIISQENVIDIGGIPHAQAFSV